MSNAHVPLSAINFDSATQVRVEINNDTVAGYAAAMNAGVVFPPVVLFRSCAIYYIGDGWHRLLAAQHNEQVTIAAEVRDGGRAAAIKYALSANADHGLVRTNADKRKSVGIALKLFPDLSSVEIAKLCAVSHTLVDNIRAEARPATVAGDPDIRVGADGRRCRTRKPRTNLQKFNDASAKDGVAVAPGPRATGRKIPDRALFIARGAIVHLETMLPNDGEYREAIALVHQWALDRMSAEMLVVAGGGK